MSQPISKQIRILQIVPRHPRKVSVEQIVDRLMSEGLKIDVRTVQRHLNNLAQPPFNLQFDGGKKRGWSWPPDAEPIQMPLVDPGTAFTYMLVDEYLKDLLPSALYRQIEAHIRGARQVLAASSGKAFKRWSERVAMLPFGPIRLPVRFDESVVPSVYSALLEGKMLRVDYRSLNRPLPEARLLHPLGLVGVDHVLYLVAVADGYDEPRQWALHRMSKASTSTLDAIEPAGFNLRDYIKQDRGFEYPSVGTVRLQLQVHDWLARQLEERPLAEDQRLQPIADSTDQRLIASVEFTDQLRWWIRSWGPAVEVQKPVRLRREFASEAAVLAARYNAASVSNETR